MIAEVFTALISTGQPIPHDYRVVETFSGGGSTIVLQAGRHGCPEGSRRALMLQPPQAFWLGCWTFDAETVTVKFEDGETIKIPLSPKPAPKPQNLS